MRKLELVRDPTLGEHFRYPEQNTWLARKGFRISRLDEMKKAKRNTGVHIFRRVAGPEMWKRLSKVSVKALPASW